MFTNHFLRRHSTRIISILPFMAALGMIAPEAQAQVEMRQGLKPFAEISSFDQNGVDIASGFSFFQFSDVGIGNLQHTILSKPDRLETFYNNFALTDNFTGFVLPVFRPGPHNEDCDNGAVDVMVGTSGKLFCVNIGGTYSAHVSDGSTLVRNPDSSLLYTDSEGTKFTFVPNLGIFERLKDIVYPDGRRIDIHFKTSSQIEGRIYHRIQSVTQNNGYQLKYSYLVNNVTTSDQIKQWQRPRQIIAVNNAVDYCLPTADSCNFSRSWPTATHNWGASAPYEECYTVGSEGKALEGPEPKPFTECVTKSAFTYINITNAAALTVKYTLDVAGRVMRVEQPDGRFIEYEYCAGAGTPGVQCEYLLEAQTGFGQHFDKVISVNNDGIIWTYSYNDRNVTNGVTDHDYGGQAPAGLIGGKRVFSRAFNLNSQLAYLQRIFEDEKTVTFSADVANRVTNVTQIDAFSEAYQYDARGNVILITRSGSGETPITTQANYDATCTNLAKCNKPNWTIDGRGNRTDYTYYPSGLLKSVTMPADDQNIRPQVRYFYEQRYAYVKNASGGYVPSSSPIWMLAKESYCISGAASGDGCATSSDEVATTYEYFASTGPSNLLVRGVAVQSRDGVRRICFRYDDIGNKIAETGPRANRPNCQ